MCKNNITKSDIIQRIRSIDFDQYEPVIDISEKTIYKYLVTVNIIMGRISDAEITALKNAFNDIPTTSLTIEAWNRQELVVLFHIR